MNKCDWADKLAIRKISRDGVGTVVDVSDSLRNWVKTVCEENIERLKKGKKLSEKQIILLIKKETKRLIEIKQEEDVREELKHKYLKKGITIYPCRINLGKISSVELPLSADEWMDVLNSYGESLPSCCVDISKIRTLLIYACQNEHLLEVDDFWQLYTLAKNHGYLSNDVGVICKIMKLWEDIEEDVKIKINFNTKSLDLNNPKDAIRSLSNICNQLEWIDIFDKNCGKDQTFRNCVDRQRNLATIATIVKTLFYKIKELDLGVIEGFGIIKDNNLESINSRLLIFRTAKLAKEVCDKFNLENCNGKQTYCVKKCSVSVEHGVRVLNS